MLLIDAKEDEQTPVKHKLLGRDKNQFSVPLTADSLCYLFDLHDVIIIFCLRRGDAGIGCTATVRISSIFAITT